MAGGSGLNMMDQQSPGSPPHALAPGSDTGGRAAMPLSSGDYIDLHEVAKGWKAAIARAKDPATRYVVLRVQGAAELRINITHDEIG